MIVRRAFILLLLLQASLCADYLKILQVSPDSTTEWLELKDGQTATILATQNEYSMLPEIFFSYEYGGIIDDTALENGNGEVPLKEHVFQKLSQYRYSVPPAIIFEETYTEGDDFGEPIFIPEKQQTKAKSILNSEGQLVALEVENFSVGNWRIFPADEDLKKHMLTDELLGEKEIFKTLFKDSVGKTTELSVYSAHFIKSASVGSIFSNARGNFFTNTQREGSAGTFRGPCAIGLELVPSPGSPACKLLIKVSGEPRVELPADHGKRPMLRISQGNTARILLEQGADLVNWSAVQPGSFSSANGAFCRLRKEHALPTAQGSRVEVIREQKIWANEDEGWLDEKGNPYRRVDGFESSTLTIHDGEQFGLISSNSQPRFPEDTSIYDILLTITTPDGRMMEFGSYYEEIRTDSYTYYTYNHFDTIGQLYQENLPGPVEISFKAELHQYLEGEESFTFQQPVHIKPQSGHKTGTTGVTLAIPNNTLGAVTLHLESSTDLETWEAAEPGEHTAGDSPLYFRLRATQSVGNE